MKQKLNKRKCKECGEVFQKLKPLQSVCSYECSIKQAKKATERKVLKKKKEGLEDLKTLGQIKNDLQPIINEISRLIDKGSNCMMCDKPSKKENGCHYHSVGSNETLRFNLHNIHLGCESCNTHKGGNIIEYDETLIKYYDREYWEYIKFNLVREYKIIKLSKEDVRELIIKARSIRNSLKKLDKTYSIQNRKDLRDKINDQLGVYLR